MKNAFQTQATYQSKHTWRVPSHFVSAMKLCSPSASIPARYWQSAALTQVVVTQELHLYLPSREFHKWKQFTSGWRRWSSLCQYFAEWSTSHMLRSFIWLKFPEKCLSLPVNVARGKFSPDVSQSCWSQATPWAVSGSARLDCKRKHKYQDVAIASLGKRA